MYDDLVEFLQESVTPFHAAANRRKLAARRRLHPAGGGRLLEPLSRAKGYLHEPATARPLWRGACRSTPSAAGASWPATATPRRGKSRPTPLKTTAAAA